MKDTNSKAKREKGSTITATGRSAQALFDAFSRAVMQPATPGEPKVTVKRYYATLHQLVGEPAKECSLDRAVIAVVDSDHAALSTRVRELEAALRTIAQMPLQTSPLDGCFRYEQAKIIAKDNLAALLSQASNKPEPK